MHADFYFTLSELWPIADALLSRFLPSGNIEHYTER